MTALTVDLSSKFTIALCKENQGIPWCQLCIFTLSMLFIKFGQTCYCPRLILTYCKELVNYTWTIRIVILQESLIYFYGTSHFTCIFLSTFLAINDFHLIVCVFCLLVHMHDKGVYQKLFKQLNLFIFDRVSHYCLLVKRKNFDISKKVINIVGCYLTEYVFGTNCLIISKIAISWERNRWFQK